MRIRLRYILLKSDYQSTALFLSLLAMVWGVWLLLPYSTFANTGIYRALGSVACEEIWGLWMLGIGIMVLLLTVDHLWARIRNGVAFTNAVTWLAVAAATMYGNPQSTGPIMYGTIGIAAAWLYMRVSLEH